MGKIKTWKDAKTNITHFSKLEKKAMELEVKIITDMVRKREEKGLTQIELGNIAGITQSTIGRIETFQGSPKLETLLTLLTSLGLGLELVPIDNTGAILPLNKKETANIEINGSEIKIFSIDVLNQSIMNVSQAVGFEPTYYTSLENSPVWGCQWRDKEFVLFLESRTQKLKLWGKPSEIENCDELFDYLKKEIVFE